MWNHQLDPGSRCCSCRYRNVQFWKLGCQLWFDHVSLLSIKSYTIEYYGTNERTLASHPQSRFETPCCRWSVWKLGSTPRRDFYPYTYCCTRRSCRRSLLVQQTR